MATEATVATAKDEAFVPMPAFLVGVAGGFQQQLYRWAYEQAKQAVGVRTPARMTRVPDLFAVMN